MTTLKNKPLPRDSTHSSQRRDLQGMRAVAVLAVFADHLFGWPSGGFVGVDVFFVLSGFFITGLLIRERTAKRKLSFKNFYIRRVKRILPSAVLVIVATVGGAYLLFPAFRAKETLLDGLWAAVFAANFRFEALGADYFQQDQPPSPLQHYWSLSIEEQFYFVWPAVLVLIFFATRKLRRRGKPWVRQWGLFGTMAAIVAASFVWALVESVNNPNGAYFSTFTRVWELGVGALVAISAPWLARIPSAIRPGLAYLGVAGVVASLFLIDSTVQFPAPWAALPVMSTALVIASFHGAEVRGMFLLTNPVARYFGDTSYTLYLWHWPVIVLLEAVIQKGPLFYGVVLAVSLGLTAVTYRFYEDPIRKSDWLVDEIDRKKDGDPVLSPSGWAVVGGFMAAVIVVSILGIRFNDKQSVVAQDDQPSVVDLTAPAAEIDPCFGAPAMLNGCVLRNPDVPLTPSIDKFATDFKGQNDCSRNEGEPLKSCTYGYMGDDGTRIALVGDSHATALLPAIRRALITNRWQVTTYVGSGCVWQTPSPGDCPIAEIEAELLAQPYDLVLTTSSRRQGGTPTNFKELWAPVAAAGSRIAVIADNPIASEDSRTCLTRVSLGDDQTGECGTSRAEGFAKPDPLIAATNSVPGTTLIDLTPFYCTDDWCPSVIGDVVVYRDTHHLTGTFVETLAPAIVDGVKRALAE